MPNLQDFISKFTTRALKPLNPMNLSGFVKGAYPGFKKRFEGDDEFGTHSRIYPDTKGDVDLLASPGNASEGSADADFEPVSPLRAAQAAYPKFQAAAKGWATEPLSFKKALQSMGDRQTENPLGYMLDASLGGFGGVPAVGGAVMAGDMAGARLGTMGGALAKGFDEAKQAGKLLQGGQKFEIADDAARMIGDLPRFFQTKKLRDILDHPELFKQYPDLADMDIQQLMPLLSNNGKGGEFTGNAIRVQGQRLPEEIKSTLLHEIQHAIQSKENWPLSEAEAYATQDRMNLSPLEREANPMSGFESLMDRMKS